MSHQHTISREVSSPGIGLHTGLNICLTLKPAPIDHGIVFRRADTNPPALVEAIPENVQDTRHATTIGKDGIEVRTIEHLMAALAGMGIDNCLIELDGPEVPAMDGSARPWVDLLQQAQRKRQFAPKTFLKVKERIVVSDGTRFLQLVPSEKLMVFYTMSFGYPFLGEQSVAYNLSRKTFIENIAPSRTYVFLQDVERLRAMGLARGGSLENTVVITEEGILNGGLRWRDELVRHKVLDVIGDLYLLGKPLVGTLIAYGAGHELHVQLVQEIQKQLTPRRADSSIPTVIEKLVTPLFPPREIMEKPAI
jgi:UDP-3-O-[3-hydroxymyristoyl] N-acetylglucosamine deacetylase